MSLNSPDYEAVLDESKDTFMRRMRTATEYYLTKSNYLESNTLPPLQAFIIYITTIRTMSPGQKPWTLFALAVRLARGMGLHSFRSVNVFPPLERELRIRVWHVLRVIDFRTAQDRGVDALISHDSFDTPLPRNFNDTDLNDQQTSYPSEQIGFSDISFGLVEFAAMTVMHQLYRISPDSQSSDQIWIQRLALVKEYHDQQYESFGKYCWEQIPVQWMLKYTIDVTVAFAHLLAVRPMRGMDASMKPPDITPEKILDIAVTSLKSEQLFHTAEIARGFRWFFWVHWNTLAVALSEICATPTLLRDEDVWETICKAYELESGQVADSAGGLLWKPVQKLMNRVRRLRRKIEEEMAGSGEQRSVGPGYFDMPVVGTEEVAVQDMSGVDFEQLDLTGMVSDDPFFYWNEYLGDMSNIDVNGSWPLI